MSLLIYVIELLLTLSIIVSVPKSFMPRQDKSFTAAFTTPDAILMSLPESTPVAFIIVLFMPLPSNTTFEASNIELTPVYVPAHR